MDINFDSTLLRPDIEFERHIFHRDQFAHYLRWSHVLKIHRVNDTVLDIGCGTGNLAEVLYRNKHKCSSYLGIDISKTSIKKAQEKFRNVNWCTFKDTNILDVDNHSLNIDADIICCFEVFEHIPIVLRDKFLAKIASLMDDKTILLFSTPCYDKDVGAANNHTQDDGIRECTFEETKKYLETYFVVEKVYGTFASQKDYKKYMFGWQLKYFEEASEYYDTNLLSNFMAFMFPEHSRNCLWRLRLR